MFWNISSSTMSSSLETLTLDHLPPSYQVHLGLFRNVQNAAFLHQQLISRNAAFEYAFIDASVVWRCPPSLPPPRGTMLLHLVFSAYRVYGNRGANTASKIGLFAPPAPHCRLQVIFDGCQQHPKDAKRPLRDCRSPKRLQQRKFLFFFSHRSGFVLYSLRLYFFFFFTM